MYHLSICCHHTFRERKIMSSPKRRKIDDQEYKVEESTSEKVPEKVSEKVPKHGEIKCQGKYSSGKNKGKVCTNGAYFMVSQEKNRLNLGGGETKKIYSYLCGQHSKSHKEDRVELQKMSTREKKEKKEDAFSLMEADAVTFKKSDVKNDGKSEEKIVGDTFTGSSKRIVLVRMTGMFPHVPARSGWMNVYPNFKTNWQGIGLVMPELSPMSLGPVIHGQPGLPNSKNIENFHQFSKFFSKFETEEEYKVNRIKGYNDSKAHRHKFGKDAEPLIPQEKDEKKEEKKKRKRGEKKDKKGKEKKESKEVGNKNSNKNVPDYFVWIDKEGKENRLKGNSGYVESRQFYCNFYERLVIKHPQFLKLKELVAQGYHLQICGPDAKVMDNESGTEDIDNTNQRSIDNINVTYLNHKCPFGHERVLYTMLIESNPDNWPWRKHKTFCF